MSSLQTILCQGFGYSHNGGVETWSGNDIGVARTRIPSFFDVMTHLLVHLVEKLELCGLVHTWWMYHVEWYLKTLKGYVGNITKPKSNMAKRYALKEALGFCLKYLVDFIAIKHQIWDDIENPSILMKCLKVVGIHKL